MGDESAMNFEGVGVSFSEFLLFSEPYLRIGSELRRERGCPVSRDLRIRIGPPMSLTYEGAKILVRGIIGLCEFRRTPLKRSSRGEIVYPIAPVWKATLGGPIVQPAGIIGLLCTHDRTLLVLT
jgi:hypothetical protein